MTITFSEPDALEKIDRLCIQLFDGWCERRSVIPLVYLMHAWPILIATPLTLTKVRGNLRDLLLFHHDSLTREDRRVIGQILAIPAYDLRGRE